MKLVPDFANQVLESCESTNDLARALIDTGCPDGTWVSARRQTRGRGRSGRVWDSQDGNLFLSVIFSVSDHLTWIPLVSAVAIVRTLQRDFGVEGARIKWPNDVWVGDRKLAGILCEGIGRPSSLHVVVGIGLNCASAPPEGETIHPATSLSACLGEPLHADQVRPVIVEALSLAMGELRSGGSREFADFYERNAVFARGTRVTWNEGRESGQVAGLGASGELLVESEAGARQSLFAEDVSKVRKA